MSDFILILASACVLLVAFAAPPIIRRATRRRQAFERHADIFFQKLDALACDDETPNEALEVFAFMNETLSMRDGGAFVLRAILGRPHGDNTQSQEFDAVIRPFLERRPELKRAFYDGFGAWLTAIVCNAHGVTGLIARLALKNSLALMDREAAARRFSKVKASRGHSDDHHHNGHAPAAA